MKKITMTRNFKYGVNSAESRDNVEIKFDSMSSALGYAYKQYQRGSDKVYNIWLVSDDAKMPVIQCTVDEEGNMFEKLLAPKDGQVLGIDTLVDSYEKQEEEEEDVTIDIATLYHKNTILAFDKVVKDIEAFKEESLEKDGGCYLYDKENSWFAIRNIKIKNGFIGYEIHDLASKDWQYQEDDLCTKDEETGEYKAKEGEGSLKWHVSYLRECLNLAKKNWPISDEETTTENED